MKYSTEQKNALINKIRADIKAGMGPKAAALKHGSNYNQFYSWTRNKKGASPAKTKAPQLVTFEIPKSQSPLFIVMGQPADVNAALERMAQIGVRL
jgi:hypothetical protein